MRIVLDTNVLVSGLLKPFGPPAQLLRLVLDGRLECAVDARILAEYDEVVHRPHLNIDPAKLEKVLGELRAVGPLGRPPCLCRRPLPDPTDEAVRRGGSRRRRALSRHRQPACTSPRIAVSACPVLRPAELVDVLRKVQTPATAGRATSLD